MKHVKVTILGCSVAIRVRPPQKHPQNNNYGVLLLDKLSQNNKDVCYTVNNRAFTRATLKDVLPKVDELISDYPDYFILNIGIPDASTREIPRFISNLITYKSHLLISVIIQTIHNFIIKPYIRLFVKLRGKRAWISEKNFENLYEKLIRYILKETNAKIIIIPINIPSKRVEDKLPGTINNVLIYNEIIKKLSVKYKIDILNINDLICAQHFPDGIHYSVVGHKRISEKIYKIISDV